MRLCNVAERTCQLTQNLSFANPLGGFQVYVGSEQVTVDPTLLFFGGQYGPWRRFVKWEVSATLPPRPQAG